MWCLSIRCLDFNLIHLPLSPATFHSPSFFLSSRHSILLMDEFVLPPFLLFPEEICPSLYLVFPLEQSVLLTSIVFPRAIRPSLLYFFPLEQSVFASFLLSTETTETIRLSPPGAICPSPISITPRSNQSFPLSWSSRGRIYRLPFLPSDQFILPIPVFP